MFYFIILQFAIGSLMDDYLGKSLFVNFNCLSYKVCVFVVFCCCCLYHIAKSLTSTRILSLISVHLVISFYAKLILGFGA